MCNPVNLKNSVALIIVALFTSITINAQKVTTFTIDAGLGMNEGVSQFSNQMDGKNVTIVHSIKNRSRLFVHSNDGKQLRSEESELKYTNSIFVGRIDDKLIHFTFSMQKSPGIYLYAIGPDYKFEPVLIEDFSKYSSQKRNAFNFLCSAVSENGNYFSIVCGVDSYSPTVYTFDKNYKLLKKDEISFNSCFFPSMVITNEGDKYITGVLAEENQFTYKLWTTEYQITKVPFNGKESAIKQKIAEKSQVRIESFLKNNEPRFLIAHHYTDYTDVSYSKVEGNKIIELSGKRFDANGPNSLIELGKIIEVHEVEDNTCYLVCSNNLRGFYDNGRKSVLTINSGNQISDGFIMENSERVIFYNGIAYSIYNSYESKSLNIGSIDLAKGDVNYLKTVMKGFGDKYMRSLFGYNSNNVKLQPQNGIASIVHRLKSELVVVVIDFND